MNSTLCQELIVEILLRLPVKPLLRFKCVCKSWFSVISNPHFAKSHFDLAARPTYRILIKSNHGSSIQSMDTEASFHDDSALLKLLLPHPSNAHVSNFRVLGCCRGFVLFDYDGSGDVMLWNPSTGVHKHIPYNGFDYKDKFLYGLGYDASTDDYVIIIKVFKIHYYSDSYWSEETQITRFESFSLKTNSWNKLGIDFEVNVGFGSFLNGALHWLNFDGIVAYDLIERSLSEIPIPDDLTMRMTNEILNLRMMVMEGCLCLAYLDARHEVAEIWIMKEYKVQSSWTKIIDLSTRCILGNFFFPMCFTRNGGIIGSTEFGGFAKFNDNGELLEHRTYDRKDMQYVVYRESLLSLPNKLE